MVPYMESFQNLYTAGETQGTLPFFQLFCKYKK